MKKRIALALRGILLCSMGAPAQGVGRIPRSPHTEENAGTEGVQPLPTSQLYDGRVREIRTGEDGAITGLRMDSERLGEFEMTVSGKTFWIDGGGRMPSRPADTAVGERLYVFHSPISTRSLPPQSAAFAVVRNIPQGAGCAMYHRAEAVELQEGGLRITTDNGGLFLSAGPETALSAYTGASVRGLGDIKAGACFMAWYDAVALSYPGQAYAQHIMLLEQEDASRPDLA